MHNKSKIKILKDKIDARMRDIALFHERFTYKERVRNIGYNLLINETDNLCLLLNKEI